MRVPASLSPFFTGKPSCRVAIIISPKELTLRSRSRSTCRRPSQSAINSTLPSEMPEACIFSLRQSS